MTHQCVLAIARLHIPDTYRGVQRARHHMQTIKLQREGELVRLN